MNSDYSYDFGGYDMKDNMFKDFHFGFPDMKKSGSHNKRRSGYSKSKYQTKMRKPQYKS